MHHIRRITIYSLLLLSPVLTFAAKDSLAAKTADSLARIKARDSLLLMQEGRRTLCSRPLENSDALSVSTSRLFISDATGPSEALAASPFSVPVRFGLSSQLNRFLPYGNVAPVLTIFSEGSLLQIPSGGPYCGTDGISIAELSSISVGPGNTYRYSLYPASVAVPEGSFLWENGVFDENILNVRFLRPLSEQMTVNLFSSNRYFKAQRFTHDGNQVSTFYKAFYTDSTAVSDTGYNPLTSEFTAGTRLRWTGKQGNEVHFGAKYADWATEMAQTMPGAGLFWARLNQYRSSIDLGTLGNHAGRAVVDVNGCMENNAIVKFVPDSTGRSLLRKDGSDLTLSFAASVTASALRKTDTVAFFYRLRHNNRGPFDMQESHALDQTPGLSYSLPYRAGPVTGHGTVNAGYIICKLDTALRHAPTWTLCLDNSLLGQHLRAFATQSAIPYSVPFDSALFLPSTLIDLYRVAGADFTLAAGKTGCIVGCQSIEGVSDVSVRHAWPEGVAPFRQPHLVFLVSPWFGPWRGLTFTTRAYIADRKPLLKAQGSLTYTAHPQNTGEYLDLRLCLDYWSGRDPLLFANSSVWNREIYDLNLEMAVHVKTFRFFSKIDNILNRSISYVPGYTLPGLTFRWGITWFLQR